MTNPAPHTDSCSPDPNHPGWFICEERHTQSGQHAIEVTDRLAYTMLNRTTFALAQALGYTLYDLKFAHDRLVEKGFPPLPHLSDIVYEAVVADRKAAS